MHIRFRFAKLGKIRFTSQRDVARMWERALRRARLPLAYTEGFSPRPRLSFGLALPTGCESEAEYLDVVLDPGRPETGELVAGELPERLTPLLPEGIEVRAVAVLQPGRGSLQQLVTVCSWTMDVAGPTRDRIEALVATFLAAPSVLVARERKGRTVSDDVRAGVRSLTVDDQRGGATTVRLVAELATQPRGIRPLELIEGVVAATPAEGATASGHHSPTPVLDRACRTQQWIECEGIRAEPLEWGAQEDADRTGYAWGRAS